MSSTSSSLPSPDQLAQEGFARQNSGAPGAARRAYRQAIVVDPRFVPALGSLANLDAQEEIPEAACLGYRRALSITPGLPALHLMLGMALWKTGRDDAGDAALEFALSLNADYVKAYFNLGLRQLERARTGEAGRCFRRGLASSPSADSLLAGLARQLGERGEAASAGIVALRALALDLPSMESVPLLDTVVEKTFNSVLGRRLFRRALAKSPSGATLWRRFGHLMSRTGENAAAAAAYRRAIASGPLDREAHLSLLAALKLVDGVSAADELAETRRYVERFVVPPFIKLASCARPDDGERRLRVGYVVGATCRFHTTSMTVLPLLEGHDRDLHDIVCYSDLPRGAGDAVTERYRRAATYVETSGLSDEDFARRIRADRIDVLADVVGFTPGSRLSALAHRPAPVQVNLFLFGSFGLPAVQWAIGDKHITPAGMESTFSERIERIELAYTYDPLVPMPPVSLRPATAARRITFSSANQIAKLSERCLVTWAAILARVPGSRLLLKGGALRDSAVLARIRDLMAGAGVDPSRVEIRGWAQTISQHLALYDETDIALDSFPYCGVVTTCEAMLMGVPVVSLEGNRVLGRYGAAFLRDIGLPELATTSEADYIDAAVALASDLPRLAELRTTLRRRMEASRLFDSRALARSLEGAYRRMWRAWCGAA